MTPELHRPAAEHIRTGERSEVLAEVGEFVVEIVGIPGNPPEERNDHYAPGVASPAPPLAPVTYLDNAAPLDLAHIKDHQLTIGEAA